MHSPSVYLGLVATINVHLDLNFLELQIYFTLGFKPTKDDIHISYLPLAHVFERVIFCLMVSHGAKVGFYRGDTLKLLDDIAELRPTLFISVPRLFNRIYDKVWSGVKAKGGFAEKLFNVCLSFSHAD